MSDESFEKALDRTSVWEEQAANNIEKWGLQDVGLLLLAVAEENGEIAADAEPVLTAEDPRLERLLETTKSSGLAVREGIERLAEDSDGTPLDNRPTFDIDDDADLDAIQDEIDDLGALVIQLQAALEAARMDSSKE